jgi:hypothetical protein
MMNAEKLGGASRPRRRRVLKLGILIFVAAVLLVAIRESKAVMFTALWDEPTSEFAEADTVYARELLDAVRGANGVLCGAMDRTFDTGYWSHSLTNVIETDFADQRSADIARWVGKRRYDVSVLSLARTALGNPDACVRRIAARIAGHVQVDRLHERLSAELSSTDMRTRTAAIFALGFADKAEAVPALRTQIQGSDRNVRVAAIWALGSIGDESSNETLVSLLERDSDPVVRSAAAWALGRIND